MTEEKFIATRVAADHGRKVVFAGERDLHRRYEHECSRAENAGPAVHIVVYPPGGFLHAFVHPETGEPHEHPHCPDCGQEFTLTGNEIEATHIHELKAVDKEKS